MPDFLRFQSSSFHLPGLFPKITSRSQRSKINHSRKWLEKSGQKALIFLQFFAKSAHFFAFSCNF
jgi:hypothetical protein